MSNPYSSASRLSADPNVSGPAIALIVVSSIALVFGVFGLISDVFLLVSGAAEMDALNQGPIPEYTKITIRTVWGIILMIASSFVLYGGIQMKNRKNYGTAKTAAIVAVIPLLGPCCILGIPFGIWALVALGKPGVEQTFS